MRVPAHRSVAPARRHRLTGLLAGTSVAALAVGLLPVGNALAAGASPTLSVLSTRADLVSGGVALVQAGLPAGTDPATASYSLNGADVTSEFATRANGAVEALVTGLVLGTNTLTVSLPGGDGASLTITDHPIGGPVFSGPQIQPWTCPAGSTDAQCDNPTTFGYEYKSNDPSLCHGGPALPISAPTGAAGCFLPYDPANPPANVPTTTTYTGKTVPYIIRIATGYQDRDRFQAAVLYDPTKPWQPWAPQAAWDGTIEIPGGSSCGSGHGATGTAGAAGVGAPGVTDDTALSRGVLVAAPALDNNGHNCNIAVQAEAVEMMKEHLVDDYGPIRFTIGSGCSGGSIYQQQVANAYPGLFDGLLPNCSFPDSWSTGMNPTECQLMLTYFGTQTAAADGLTPAQESQIVDDQTTSVCESWVNVYGYSKLINPSNNGSPNNCGVGTNANDPNSVYNASTNPGGVRCDLADYMANVLGLRPSSAWTSTEQSLGHGFTNEPFDNTGVEYGLNALLAGTVTAQQFVDLNSGVGGFSVDAVPTAARSAGDAAGLTNVYNSGAVDEANNLNDVAIIDLRGHDDAEIHSDYRTYAMRARLDAAQGNHDNQAIWVGPAPLVGYTSMTADGFLAMHQWLTNVFADTSSKTRAQKIRADKPANAVDTCFDATGDVISHDPTVCTTAYPYYGSPRVGAGEPLTDDILKCQLKPLSQSDFPSGEFTAAQWTALQATYPHGVCDWTKRGVAQAPTIPWQTYQAADGSVIYGGQALPPAPTSAASGPSADLAEAPWQPVLLLVGIAGLAGVAVLRRRRGGLAG